jgi:hypothetical protein
MAPVRVAYKVSVEAVGEGKGRRRVALGGHSQRVLQGLQALHFGLGLGRVQNQAAHLDGARGVLSELRCMASTPRNDW